MGLRKFDLKSEIKWPNDIYIEGKKIAGVLIENQIKNYHLFVLLGRKDEKTSI